MLHRRSRVAVAERKSKMSRHSLTDMPQGIPVWQLMESSAKQLQQSSKNSTVDWDSPTEAISLVKPRSGSVTTGPRSESEDMQKTYKPNRKVVSGAVAGLATLAAFYFLGPDADPEISSGLTLVAMTVISYLVPLPEDAE